MTDQPEKIRETEDAEADFEGHKLTGPEKAADTTDTMAAADEDADFEGHRFGPDKAAGTEKLV